jgi:hypothetical protein
MNVGKESLVSIDCGLKLYSVYVVEEYNVTPAAKIQIRAPAVRLLKQGFCYLFTSSAFL